MISEIVLWLNDKQRRFAHGALLYEKYGCNKANKDLFALGENNFSWPLLMQELKKASDAAPEPKKSPMLLQAQAERKLEPVETAFMQKRLQPARIQEVEKVWKKLYDECRFTKSKIDQLAETKEFNAQRRVLAQENEGRWEIISTLWDEVDFWKKNGREMPAIERMNLDGLQKKVEPVEVKFKELHRDELIRKRLSKASSRSRLRKDKEKNALKIAALDKEIQELDDLIGE